MFCKTMESRVSNREAKFNEFKKSQDEFRISQAKFRAEVLLQFRLLAEKLGVESSAATPTHQLFIKSTSPLSLEKSNEIVLKLQSFHKEKVRAREKREEFWSQFRPRYKPKSPHCLRPILKKFKRVRCSHQCSEFPSYQPLKREDLDHGNKSRPCSVSEKLEAHDMIQGFLKDETLEFGCKKIWVTEIGEEIYPFRSKPATILESDCKNGKSQVFILEIHVSNVGFYKTELPGSRALYLFDKMSTSGYILDIKLGYHMSIRDKGGTNFLFNFESIDLLASCKDLGFYVVIHRFMGYYYKGILDKGGTISQRLFNSKSNNKDCVLGSDCSKVFKCEGIRDKGGGSKFRTSADDEEKMVNLYFNRIGWPSSFSTNENESFVKNVLQKKKMAMDEFLMSAKLTLRPGVEEFIDDAYTEGIHVVVLTTYSKSRDQIGRSIVEKLGEERISKLKIVRDKEVDLSLYTQLVNDIGFSFGVDEL